MQLVPARIFGFVTAAAAGLCKLLSCHCQADGKVSCNVLTIEFSFFWYFSLAVGKRARDELLVKMNLGNPRK